MVVLATQREFQDALERDPIEFLAPERGFLPRLDSVRAVVANQVGANASDIAWVRNATDGVNAVVNSVPLGSQDNIVITNHGYNASNNAVRHAADRAGAGVKVATIPFPISRPSEVLDAIDRAIDSCTRLLVVDHITSPTGLLFPIRQIVERARDRGARVLVDGAHAPGMVPIDLKIINADYYTGNHHKWWCAPKASGFLWVRRQWHSEVRPNVISHAANRPIDGRSQFVSEFDWTGTFDPSALLSVPAAIEFLASLMPGGIPGLMQANRQLAIRSRDHLCQSLGIEPPAPDEMLGSLVALPISPTDRPLQKILREEHGFELPIYPGIEPGSDVMRISLQAYNDFEQIERLAKALA